MNKILKILSGKSFSIRLKTQLIASFMVMILIVLIISSIMVYAGMVNILNKQTEKEKVNQFQQLEYNIDSFIKEVDKISKMLIVSQDIQDYLVGNHNSDIERTLLINRVFDELSQEVSRYEYIESIFFYGETGYILGKTAQKNIINMDERGQSHFYETDLYRKVKSDILGLHWFGGLSAEDFEMDTNVQTVNPFYYISAARSINYSGKQIATIVINVNERYFTSIYNNNPVEDESILYIMDDKGIIISNTDQSQINLSSMVFEKLEQDSLYGSIFFNQGSPAMNIIYYHMSKTGWILVNEIPLEQLIRGIFELRKILLLVFAFSIIMAFSISIYWIYVITKPLNKLTKAMQEMEEGKLGHVLPETSKNELGVLGRQFNRMSESIMMLVDSIKSIEDEKRIIEIKALQAQINPHFLYNTLNTIKHMAGIHKAKNVTDSLTVLGSILRSIFQNTDFLCTIEEEVEFAKNYIRIMNMRYGEGISIDIDIPDELLHCQILRFILQPMIENSFQHGLVLQNYIGIMHIAAEEKYGEIHLVVEDNGTGIEDERLVEIREIIAGAERKTTSEDGGIGLPNVNRRIKLHYGENYGIDIVSKKGIGTKVVIRVPRFTGKSY